ncbi:hypothetical protein B0H34DRAFT_721842 [Crassisporium funariophilum]|nr:hypothetical protein B0H34DRAFT_721842 [Crassisporium funariophilum]
MEMQAETHSNPSNVVEAYGSYPFDSDETYQQGLASILAGGALNISSSSEVQEEMLRQTRVFYFNKITGSVITMDEARACDQKHAGNALPMSTGASQDINGDDETRVLTFAELKEMIETGNVDKIPNNKIIPEGLNVSLRRSNIFLNTEFS